MKILIATGLYAPEIGGPATYTKMLEEDLPTRGFDLEVVPFSLVRLYPKFFRHIRYFWLVWKASKHVQVVYALDPVSVGVPAWLAAKLRRKVFLVRLGGDYSWEQGRVRFAVKQTLDEYIEHIPTQPFPVRLLFKVQSFVTRQAAQVVVPSAYLKSIVEQWGVDPSKIKVIYSTLFPLVPTTEHNSLASDAADSSLVVVTAGRLVPWKGITSVITVIKKLHKTYPNIRLVIVGSGPEEQNLKQHVADNNLQQIVSFVGQQSKSELANTIAGADLFVLNTAYEGLSHQLLEVMDLEIPIVTTNVGGNPELLTDDETALLVPFDDIDMLFAACDRLLAEPQTTQRLVNSAKERVSTFSRSAAVDAIDSLLKSYE